MCEQQWRVAINEHTKIGPRGKTTYAVSRMYRNISGRILCQVRISLLRVGFCRRLMEKEEIAGMNY